MSMKQSLNPTPFFNANKKQRKVHSTKRVYFHAELHQVKVVDEYNNVLAMAESVKMTVTRRRAVAVLANCLLSMLRGGTASTIAISMTNKT